MNGISGMDLVLKLHYDPDLEADKGVKLIPEHRFEDPVPFIRCTVSPGTADFVIRAENGMTYEDTGSRAWNIGLTAGCSVRYAPWSGTLQET